MILDDSDAGSTEDELNESKGITSLTPFLERKGLDFSDPNTVVVKNFDILWESHYLKLTNCIKSVSK